MANRRLLRLVLVPFAVGLLGLPHSSAAQTGPKATVPQQKEAAAPKWSQGVKVYSREAGEDSTTYFKRINNDLAVVGANGWELVQFFPEDRAKPGTIAYVAVLRRQGTGPLQ